jgi:hypothetical protein
MRSARGFSQQVGWLLESDPMGPAPALSWFHKAVKLGDDGSNLEIA